MSTPQMPTVTVGPNTFTYAAIRRGRPKIRIWLEGQNNEAIYMIDPNPTGTKGYEKNPERVFRDLALVIGTAFTAAGAWPATVDAGAKETALGTEVELQKQ